MNEEQNKSFITIDTTHAIRTPQQVEEIIVQTADLKRLRWHVDRITIPEPSYDLVSAIIGSGISLIIPCIKDSIHSIDSLIVYLLVFFALALTLVLILTRKNKSARTANPQQALDEVIQDLKTIYEKATLSYSSPYDYATDESQADHTSK